ncbi:hypothetical protein [Pedobacter sp. UBA5917]|jgi:hypothetical protein|uniref:hypothetical protein n=1 Tax=Pedobacter sp. UBA5917 TaxID=1947061 RepID=UPI0025E8A6A2|nr:hypothetical protein [Pedobacter sp. UBA5917]
MTKKIIIAVFAVFIVLSGVTFWIFNTFDQTTNEANARTEADFTTARFVAKELWVMEKKQNDRVLMSYLFIKPEKEDISLRLPWQGNTEDEKALANKIKEGDTVEVKVLKSQLASAREAGVGKAISRFIMGDKREVTIFKLTVKNELLVEKGIHDWDEAKITLLGRLTDNPWLLLIPFFILMYIIGIVNRKKAKQQRA